jgi:hypothetical protein
MRSHIAAVFVGMIACWLLVVACSQSSGPDLDGIGSIVKESMQHKFDSDASLREYHMTVEKVDVLRSSGNSYKGLATVHTQKGDNHDVAIDVTVDGDKVLWQAPPGSFAFAIQEQVKGAVGAPQTGLPAALPTPNQAASTPPGTTTLQATGSGWVYVTTKSGKTACQVNADEVDCQSAFTFNTPMSNGMHANGVRFTSTGETEWVSGDLGDIPTTTLDYGTYRALTWSIDASSDGTRFTNTSTGHSIFISVDRVDAA